MTSHLCPVRTVSVHDPNLFQRICEHVYENGLPLAVHVHDEHHLVWGKDPIRRLSSFMECMHDCDVSCR
jgi:hypothetical protein